MVNTRKHATDRHRYDQTHMRSKRWCWKKIMNRSKGGGRGGETTRRATEKIGKCGTAVRVIRGGRAAVRRAWAWDRRCQSHRADKKRKRMQARQWQWRQQRLQGRHYTEKCVPSKTDKQRKSIYASLFLVIVLSSPFLRGSAKFFSLCFSPP